MNKLYFAYGSCSILPSVWLIFQIAQNVIQDTLAKMEMVLFAQSVVMSGLQKLKPKVMNLTSDFIDVAVDEISLLWEDITKTLLEKDFNTICRIV